VVFLGQLGLVRGADINIRDDVAVTVLAGQLREPVTFVRNQLDRGAGYIPMHPLDVLLGVMAAHDAVVTAPQRPLGADRVTQG